MMMAMVMVVVRRIILAQEFLSDDDDGDGDGDGNGGHRTLNTEQCSSHTAPC